MGQNKDLAGSANFGPLGLRMKNILLRSGSLMVRSSNSTLVIVVPVEEVGVV